MHEAWKFVNNARYRYHSFYIEKNKNVIRRIQTDLPRLYSPIQLPPPQRIPLLVKQSKKEEPRKGSRHSSPNYTRVINIINAIPKINIRTRGSM